MAQLPGLDMGGDTFERIVFFNSISILRRGISLFFFSIDIDRKLWRYGNERLTPPMS